MTSEVLGEMFEGDSADMCARKCPLLLMGCRAEGLACEDPGAKTPIGVSGNFLVLLQKNSIYIKCPVFWKPKTNINTNDWSCGSEPLGTVTVIHQSFFSVLPTAYNIKKPHLNISEFKREKSIGSGFSDNSIIHQLERTI